MRSLFTSLGRNDAHPTPLMEELESRQLYSASHLHPTSLTPAHLSARRARHHQDLIVSVNTNSRRRAAVNTDFGGFYGIFSNTDFGGFRGIATGQITASQAFAPPFRSITLSSIARF
ncbi:MAG: hypothetical protein ACM359_18105 [Bacillota bacterium]